MTKKYKINHSDTSWEMEVEIDHSVADKIIKEMVEFWSGWECELRYNGGDYTQLFLKNLGYKVWREVAYHDWNLRGVLDIFEDSEGWYQMDGRCGVTILRVESDPTDKNCFEVKAI